MLGMGVCHLGSDQADEWRGPGIWGTVAGGTAGLHIAAVRTRNSCGALEFGRSPRWRVGDRLWWGRMFQAAGVSRRQAVSRVAAEVAGGFLGDWYLGGRPIAMGRPIALFYAARTVRQRLASQPAQRPARRRTPGGSSARACAPLLAPGTFWGSSG